MNRPTRVNALNQVTSAGPAANPTATYGYDGNGNLAVDGNRTFTYTVDNQLANMTEKPDPAGTPVQKMRLTYDPFGLLTHVREGDTTTYTDTYFHRVGGEIATEVDGAGTVLRRYVRGAGADEPLTMYEGASNTVRRHLIADERGSIVAIVGGNEVKTVVTYDEYGIPSAGYTGRFGYTGQAWLPGLGLYDYKARMYSPTLGRFMQTDPIGYGDGLNWYNYVGGDPLNALDPSGQRQATRAEAGWISKTFGGVLDSAASSPFFIRGAAWGVASHVGASLDIYFTNENYEDDFSKAGRLSENRRIFYHELWHLFEIRVGITSFTKLALNQALAMASGDRDSAYTIQNDVDFMSQNAEARADIFARAVMINDFSAMNGFYQQVDSQTTISVNNGTLTVTIIPTGTRLPRTYSVGSSSSAKGAATKAKPVGKPKKH